MKIENVKIMGMEQERWRWKSCTADFGVGDDRAILYDIRSKKEGKGHATELLTQAKKHYEEQTKKVMGSIALNSRIRKIYKRLEIKEYLNCFRRRKGLRTEREGLRTEV